MGISGLDHVLGATFVTTNFLLTVLTKRFCYPSPSQATPALPTALTASGLVGAARKVPFPGMASFFFPAWKICWCIFKWQMLAQPQDSSSGAHHWGGEGRRPPSPPSPALAGWALGPPGSQRWPGVCPQWEVKELMINCWHKMPDTQVRFYCLGKISTWDLLWKNQRGLVVNAALS